MFEQHIKQSSRMSWCSLVLTRKLMMTLKRKEDDRPFSQQKKPILPIKGFKGNRIIYEDIFDFQDETTCQPSIQNEEHEEPLYNEPDLTESNQSDYQDSNTENSSLKHGSSYSPESGYISSTSRGSFNEEFLNNRESFEDEEDIFFHSSPGKLHINNHVVLASFISALNDIGEP